MRGILSGLIVGGVTSLVLLGAASQYLPEVRLSAAAPKPGAVAVPAGSEFNAERPDAPPILPGTEARPENTQAPMVSEPEAAAESLPDTTPLQTPETTPLDETAMAVPEVPPSPEIVVGTGSGGAPETEQSQPSTPVVDMAPSPEASVEAPETGIAPVAPETGTAPEAPETGIVQQAPEASITKGTPDALDDPLAEVDVPPVSMPEISEGLRLPVPEIADMSPGITTDRLPRIGAEPVEAVAVEASALRRNALRFGPVPDTPLLAMILLDVGSVRPDQDVLADFPVPLTVALDSTASDAPELMQFYRAAGLEVVIVAPLPQGAAPADVEVAFQGYLDRLPEAVAVMDTPDNALQDSRPRAAQVVEILSESGHGLITYDQGLNTALQIASRANVPAASIFRNIDSGTHDVAAMKRFLDQGAFRAGQQGSVLLVAEARAETITALAEWTLGSRAASVTFVPVSVLLERRSN